MYKIELFKPKLAGGKGPGSHRKKLRLDEI